MLTIPTSTAQSFSEAPKWAQLMRSLFDRMPDAVDQVCKRYLAEDGSVLWPQPEQAARGLIDGLDDAYESFHAWPLAYMLGADPSLLKHAEDGFDAVTKQFAKVPTGHGHPMVVQEFEQGYDWFHQGEGYLVLYYLCAANPERAINQERVKRFAGFLRNKGVPEPNFDFDTFHFRCPHIGSMGPGFRNFSGRSTVYRHLLKYYGLPFQTEATSKDPWAFFEDEDNLEKYGREAEKRIGRGDSATNLASTTLAVHAYLFAGDTEAKDWALRYIDNWIDKAKENGGLLPDNVGLSGKIGEHTNGDWFGANYGWVWPHGWGSLGKAVTLASQNGYLLTGDPKYPAFLRSQLEILAKHAVERDGTLHLPHKHSKPGWHDYDTSIPMLSQVLREPDGPILWKDGWYEFMPMKSQYPVWLWEMTGASEDEELLLRLRNHRQPGWKSVETVPAKDLGDHSAAWAAYLRGEFPDYPERILEHNHAQMDERLAFMENDTQDPATYGDSYLQARNPVSNEGLVQLTLGTSMPVYNGGLMMSRLRYFDPARRRSGLPQDVSALVEGMDDRSVKLCLVNLHEQESRDIVIRAGFFGEHQFVGAQSIDTGENLLPETNADASPGDLHCQLPPKSSFRLILEMKRFVNTPHGQLPDWTKV